MRVALKGVQRDTTFFTFTYDGKVIEASAGESIAAALTAAGEMACRQTRSGQWRGLFCGMGVCGDCTVVVDGRATRACMEPAAPGLHVEPQYAHRDVRFFDPVAARDIGTPPLNRSQHDAVEQASAGKDASAQKWVQREVDVLVVGAGPAGLAAASAAARRAAGVLVIDERKQAGGQYFKQPGDGFTVDDRALDAQFREGRRLYQAALNAGADFLFGSTVWGAFHNLEVSVARDGANYLLKARRIVLAPGAFERPRPFPGWTLPGVMTTGAAQTLLRAYQTTPGDRVLVAGNGPLNLQVARELSGAGAEVVAVSELAPAPSFRSLGYLATMSLTSPGLVWEGINHRLHLAQARVPLYHDHAVVHAHGAERVQEVTIARVDGEGRAVSGTEKRFSVDAVCLGYGFVSQSEIARALGASHYHTERAYPTLLDEEPAGRSPSAPAVFVVGDASRLGGARVAQAQGALAGEAAARDLGFSDDADGNHAESTRTMKSLRRHQRFQRALWSLYAAPSDALTVADSNTIICRCEGVTRGQFDALLAEGVTSIGAIKRETRAGMGRCQGRYCAGMLVELLRDKGQLLSPLEQDAFFAPRPPFKPMTIGDLATRFDEEAAFDRTAGASAPGSMHEGAARVP